ncbi:hypothetical protein Tco_0915604 [Tanacetum coccineum]
MSTDKESSTAGTDNRPPMLVESNYDSWKIRIERYIRGKPLGNTNNERQATNILSQGLPRHVFNILNQTRTGKEIWDNVELLMKGSGKSLQQHKKELADIQATNILSQGLPRYVFNILNQTRTGKEIWDNVELLMKGSGKSLQQKKEELFDEYERFHAIGNESIHDYFVRFHKLIRNYTV